jgi:hypothetical protein
VKKSACASGGRSDVSSSGLPSWGGRFETLDAPFDRNQPFVRQAVRTITFASCCSVASIFATR